MTAVPFLKMLTVRKPSLPCCSRFILHHAVLALDVSVELFVYLNGSSFPGATLGIDNLVYAMHPALDAIDPPNIRNYLLP